MRVAGGALLVAALACATAPARREAPPRTDRTDDPDFVAALEAAQPDFETQADALAAGIYEPFVHPDSIRPAVGGAPAMAPPADAPPVDFAPEDPTTEELLGTLPSPPMYNPQGRDSVPGQFPSPPTAGTSWTLQVGAFGAETGALVRLRQLERDFPHWPRWHVGESGVFRVYVGRFADRAAAERARIELADRGYGDAWVVSAP